MILLVNVPIPVPSDVCREVVVGAAVVDQQTPLAVMAPPPASVMFPPDVAAV